MKNQRTVATMGTLMGAPIVFSLITDWSLNLSSGSALTFAFGVSVFSMAVIAGVAFLGAYKFLKNVGPFKGHYYY